MRVRPATAADIPAILDLERGCATAAHWTEAQYTQIFSPGAPRRIALIAEQTVLGGFIVLKEAAGEWELENIVVDESERRRGTGTSLLQTALEHMRTRNGANIFLEVRPSNKAARKFYQKHGFQEAGRRRNYYQNPTEDAVILTLTLVTKIP